MGAPPPQPVRPLRFAGVRGWAGRAWQHASAPCLRRATPALCPCAQAQAQPVWRWCLLAAWPDAPVSAPSMPAAVCVHTRGRAPQRPAPKTHTHTLTSPPYSAARSTDMIVGFCGEEEEDHAASLDLMRSVGYDQAFLFAYSMRDKTHAARHYQARVPPVPGRCAACLAGRAHDPRWPARPAQAGHGLGADGVLSQARGQALSPKLLCRAAAAALLACIGCVPTRAPRGPASWPARDGCRTMCPRR